MIFFLVFVFTLTALNRVFFNCGFVLCTYVMCVNVCIYIPYVHIYLHTTTCVQTSRTGFLKFCTVEVKLSYFCLEVFGSVRGMRGTLILSSDVCIALRVLIKTTFFLHVLLLHFLGLLF